MASSARSFALDDLVEITKPGKQKGNHGRVLDPDWKGLVKVEMTSGADAGQTKSFDTNDVKARPQQAAKGAGPAASPAGGSDRDTNEVKARPQQAAKGAGPAASPAASPAGGSDRQRKLMVRPGSRVSHVRIALAES